MTEGSSRRPLLWRAPALLAVMGVLGGCGRRANTQGTGASATPAAAPAAAGQAPVAAGLRQVRLTVPTIT
jgi:hypothetical protein